MWWWCGKFFSIWILIHEHSRFTGQQGKGEAVSLIPLCHFHQLPWHLDITRAITVESSPLHTTRNRNRTGNFLFWEKSLRVCRKVRAGSYSARSRFEVMIEKLMGDHSMLPCSTKSLSINYSGWKECPFFFKKEKKLT